MTRYYGAVGYFSTEETLPGVWTESITERQYRGDVTSNTRRLETGECVNDDLNIQNKVSIVADAYAYENYMYIKYAEVMGVRWKVTSVEVSRPRLVLTLGGVYNGSTD